MQHPQGGRFRQRPVLAPQLGLQLLELFGLCSERSLIDLDRHGCVGLLAALAPGLDLLGIDAFAPAKLAQLDLVKRGALDHYSELLFTAQLPEGHC